MLSYSIMTCSPTNQLCTFISSPATFLYSHRCHHLTSLYGSPIRRRHLPCASRPHGVRMASKNPNKNNVKQPQAKPAFYKNPSRAIEKGGGFFIPGLRGPRLRFFVSIVSASLLSVNHVLSPQVASGTLRTSEAIATFSICCVFITALIDTTLSQPKFNKSSTTTETNQSTSSATTTSAKVQSSPSNNGIDNDVSWALETCKDLTSVTHIVAFHNGSLSCCTNNIVDCTEPGEVVQRVQQEQRALYVSDSSDLPPDVKLPFLLDGSWTVFVMPVDEASVVVFGKQVDDKELSSVDRRWLEAFAPRLIPQLIW